ncbi:MAG: putative LPS assembly protein LptD [candidate division KSB1 bacterium]|nr:putative LPS assembly protein LptD [candidate division KSB1 bacterium]
MRSNATYTKRWREQGVSMSANLTRTHDLQTGLTSSILPQISLRLGRMQPFKSESNRGVPAWYEAIYVSYNSNLQNSEREFMAVSVDGEDSVAIDRTRQVGHSVGLSMSSPTKYFGWLSLNQSLNINEDWYDEQKNYFYNEKTDEIDYETESGFAARHTFSYSASANTKIYGMFPGFGFVSAFRHVITPSVSYSYQPDFSKSFWGYYDKVRQSDGSFAKRDRFSGTSSSGRSSISWRMGNLFQMKTGEGADAKKYDLFNLNLSGGYNFRADRQKMSDVSASLQASPMSNLSLSANSSHSFYEYSSDYHADPVFLFSDGGWQQGRILRLTNLQFNVRFRLQGRQKSRDSEPGPQQDLPQSYEEMQLREEGRDLNVLEEEAFKRGDRFESDFDMQSWSVLWRMNVSFNFNLNKRNPDNPIKRYYMDISGAEISLTPNWRIQYSAHYDLEEMSISHHQFTIYRDLHCWEAHLEWRPSGRSRGVYFKINIKAPCCRILNMISTLAVQVCWDIKSGTDRVC